ncbi:hypothetical protein Patl1_20669 [Pistacia atlantica]|uniref:Uncharacterized protein n=1 Tax=Pistacia atlantica TaxID=434234 RepID=A0ACC1BHY7_9ROSI|nr:hypothetical protein Patl1_20669 [Pistacia atlantica]
MMIRARIFLQQQHSRFPFLRIEKPTLAKAISNHTTASFIRVVGSGFVHKNPVCLLDNCKACIANWLVGVSFHPAKGNAPAVIFIKEVDAFAAARFDTNWS